MSLLSILRMLVLLVLVCTVVVQSKRTAEEAMAKDPQKQFKELSTIYLQSPTRTLRIKRRKGDILKSCKVYNKVAKGKKTEKFVVSPIDETQMDIFISRCEEAKQNTRYEPEDRQKRFLLAPGTLWCGAGNSAEGNTSLVGSAEATDRCCLAHDFCTPGIRAFEYDTFGYGLYNFAIWSKHRCSTCNLDFYNCLKDAGTGTASLVGTTFFNILDIGCFDFVHPEKCISTFWGICTEWTRDPEQDKQWELLNNPYTY